MTRIELDFIRKLLTKVKPQDEQVQLAIAYIDKNIAIYNAQRGQLKDMYERTDYGW